LKIFRNTSTKIFFDWEFIDDFSCLFRELLQRFKTQELIHWKDILKNFESDLKNGSKEDPATTVFVNNDDGKKRWEDFKVRVVEHVSPSIEIFSHSEIYFLE
jgi:hypothetical protein